MERSDTMRQPALLLALCLALTACGSDAPVSSLAEPATTPSTAESSTAGTTTAPQTSMPQTEEEMPEQVNYDIPQDVAERMVGNSWNGDAPVQLDDLAYLAIPYRDFDGVERMGEMVVHKSLAEEVLEIFAELYDAGFPLARMQLIDDYGADDLASMAANNSSAFCARLILGTDRWSVHSYGAAVDINPVQNPYVTGGSVYPESATKYMNREDARPGMVVEGDVCYNAFTSRGWTWGGHWDNPDYQHFEKDLHL